MDELNYSVLEKSGYKGYILKDAPVKILQFGEGNFLRAFVDYWFDMSNEHAGFNGKAVLVQPIAQGLTDLINKQEGLYTLYLRGSENGEKVNRKRVISCVKSCRNPYDSSDWEIIKEVIKSEDLEYIVSNTTEAGIVYDSSVKADDLPPASFPGKLTVLLHERFKAGRKGLVILSCELIDNNGRELLKCVKKHAEDFGYEDDFILWLEKECLFCSTLVDRIVPGRIRDQEEVKKLEEENGYSDPLTDVGEVFGVWYIEGPEWLEEKLPFKKAGLNVHVVPEVAPYKKRKVRILNGAHTGFVLGAYLGGFDIVRDCMHDETIHSFMNKILYDEVIPILPLDKKDCENFAAAVTDRFNNPFVDHQLLSISLNSTSKWKARDLSSLLDYVDKFHSLPEGLCMGFAAYIAFYTTNIKRLDEDGLICERHFGDKSNEYKVMDDRPVLEFYFKHRDSNDKDLVRDVLSNKDFWDRDLTEIDGLYDKVLSDLSIIREKGSIEAYRSVIR